MLGTRPFDRSLMTPINATDMQRFNTQQKSQIPVTIPQLRTPSSFTKNIPYLKVPYENRPDAKVNAETKDNERNVSGKKMITLFSYPPYEYRYFPLDYLYREFAILLQTINVPCRRQPRYIN